MYGHNKKYQFHSIQMSALIFLRNFNIKHFQALFWKILSKSRLPLFDMNDYSGVISFHAETWLDNTLNFTFPNLGKISNSYVDKIINSQ